MFLSTFQKTKKSRGFTFIELLIVLSIFSLLASIIFSAVNNSRIKARDAKRQIDMDTIRKAMEMYYSENEEYPDSSNWSSDGWVSLESSTDFRDAMSPYLSAIPEDPAYNSENQNLYTYKYKSDDGTGYDLYAKKEGSSVNTWLETNATGNSITSGEATTSPGYVNTAPSVPTGLYASPVSSTQIDLVWNSNGESDLIGYKIYRDGLFITAVGLNSYLDEGLQPDTVYTYTISAYDTGDLESQQSGSVSSQTLASISAPTNLHTTSIYADKVELAWESNNPSGIEYEIYRDGSGPIDLTTDLNYIDNSVVPGMSYGEYQVCTTGGINCSDRIESINVPKALEIGTTIDKNKINVTNNLSSQIPANSFNITVNGSPVSSINSQINSMQIGIVTLNDAQLAMLPDPANLIVNYGSYSDTKTNASFYGNAIKCYWKLDESSGATSFSDSSYPPGVNDTGTCSGSACPTVATGKFNNAFNFDGSNDYVTVLSSSDIALPQPLTIGLWFNPSINITSATNNKDILYKSGAYRLFIENGKIALKDTSGNGMSTSQNSWSAGNWYHIVFVVSGTTTTQRKIYVNGSDVATVNSGNNWSGTGGSGTLYIGNQSASANNWFNGTIDDVRIMNVARSMSTN